MNAAMRAEPDGESRGGVRCVSREKPVNVMPSATRTPAAGSPARALRVLLVEDEFLIRWSIAETLSGHGHTVLQAETAATARVLMQEAGECVDVVLLDYRLPDSHDLGLLAEVRQRWPRAPVVLMSAFATPEVAAAARRLGAYDVIRKPLEMQALAILLETAGHSRRV